MAFEPTKAQEAAIQKSGNILVSAAAGSGKTAVLVERVAKLLIEKKYSADRLLIVTFTNAAAAEMRTRIEKRLSEEIQKSPNDEHLQKQKYLLQNADICTIDSFCIKLVRQNFEKLGIEPDFDMLDDVERVRIAKALAFEIVTEQLENPTEAFTKLLEFVNSQTDKNNRSAKKSEVENLVDLLMRVHDYSQQMTFPHVFVESLYLPYVTDFVAGNLFYDLAIKTQVKQLDEAYKLLKIMDDYVPYVAKNEADFKKCVTDITALIDELKLGFENNDWDAIYSKLKNTTVFESKQSSTKEDQYARDFRSTKTELKNLCNNLLETVFKADHKGMEDILAADADAVKLFADLLTDYTNRLFEEFRKKNAFTFYNTEQMALGLLCEYKDGEIVNRDEAKNLASQYDEVLVDEFQDVNDLQDRLFHVLSDCEKKLFVVGDIKQSIYGFRGSNPANFLSKKNRYIHIDKATSDDQPRKIILSDNFRSRKGVCNAVNFFFSQLMAGQCGDIIYDKDEYLNAGGTFPESTATTTDFLLVDTGDVDEEKAAIKCEARKIADYILSVMQEDEFITDEDEETHDKFLRKACYGDFAILVDTTSNIDIIANALKERGIPVSLNGDSFLESIEISSVTSLLKVIDNPKSDVELLEVMMSPSFAFTAEEMATIRAERKKCPLYSAVVYAAKNGNEKCKNFVETLAQFRRDAAVLSIDRLISKLIHSTDILNMVSALPNGKARKENLFTLINYAKKYSASYDSGIYGFIKYMDSFPEKAIKRPSSAGNDAVRIMTMHKSKGLQFPICIVAKLESSFRTDDATDAIVYSEKGGISFKYYDEQTRQDVQMFSHKIMSETARVKITEEKLRLLYVALTRAIDRLCLVYATKDLDAQLSKLVDTALLDKVPYIKREFLETDSHMGNWLLACMLTHPCGETLRDRLEKPVSTTEDDTNINVIITKCEKESEPEEEKISDGAPKTTEANQELVEKIKANFEFEYAHEKLRHLQAKSSVSRLVHADADDSYDFSETPAFMLGDKLTGAARGTATHHIMQYIDMAPTVDVNAEIERLIEWKYITEREASSADVAAIDAFFKTPLYSRIIANGKPHREMRFLTEIPANRFNPTLDLEANIMVQGAIDLCFIEDDGVVVLDFKTDKVDNVQTLVDRYGEQLEIYSTAAEKIFGLPVKEKIIYSFHLGESKSF